VSVFRQVADAAANLAYFVITLKLFGFGAARRLVTKVPIATRRWDEKAVTVATRAVDLACVYSPRKIQCLERAAVMTRILRRKGVPAYLVIGVRPIPFNGHAWVEINGNVAYGGIDGMKHYQIIDRA
jgi:hypothetical protein